MAVIHLKNEVEKAAEDLPSAGDALRSATGELRQMKQPIPQTALHEGGIVLTGTRAIDFQAAERFRILRAKIERMNLTDVDRRVIAVTSAVPEEGKSLIAANLARALAMDPRGKTILVDCDLRKPAVHRYFGIPFTPGLSDALVGNRSLANVIQAVEPGLDIIPAGSPVIDATRAVELPQLAQTLQELKKHYRYVVVDCPPVLLCPEPLVLSSLVEGTIMVVRAWRTHKKLVSDAVNAIGREKFIGVIVNDAKDALNEYGYYGYYGYDSRGKGRKGQGNAKNPNESKPSKFPKIGKKFAGMIPFGKGKKPQPLERQKTEKRVSSAGLGAGYLRRLFSVRSMLSFKKA